MLTIPAHRACTPWRCGGRRNADCQLDHAASGCSPGGVLSLLRHMATMGTLAALGWSICATGAGAASHVEAPARLVAQHRNPAKRRTVLALLSHGYLPYSVASDSKLLETSRGLGTGGPATSRHRGQQRARGEKVWNVAPWKHFLFTKSWRHCSRPNFGHRTRLWPQK